MLSGRVGRRQVTLRLGDDTRAAEITVGPQADLDQRQLQTSDVACNRIAEDVQ